MNILMILLILPTMIFASQRVVTGLDCEVTSGSSQQWEYTTYGAQGGRNGGRSGNDGRLFEFDCQTEWCLDSEGERGHWWVTCGYSWRNVDELTDSMNVIVDVKTEAHNGHGSCNDNSYTRALNFDSEGWHARDTHGNSGHWDFWVCYKTRTWSQVKSGNYQIVTDLAASTQSSHGSFARIGQWDTHNDGHSRAYGDMRRTGDWMYLFQKKAQPEIHVPAKVIGSWTFETVSRPLNSDIEYEITRTAESSRTDEISTSETNFWANHVAETHSVEVAVEASAEYGPISGSVSSKYGYTYEHAREESFESQLHNLASTTYAQSTTVTHTYTIPKQVHGEPIYSNVWFFKFETINEDLQNGIHYMVDNGIEVHGCGYHIAPNCLPGYCSPYDPHCWSCTTDWAIIDPDFVAPPACGGEGEGCDWVPVSSADCPSSSLARFMGECTEDMDVDELCEADTILPNGERNFNINNCGPYDVFRYECH